MRDNSVDAFFALMRAGLFPVHGEGVKVNESLFCDVDWEKVYQLAQEQSVQGLVLQGIETVQGSWLKVHGSPLVPKVLLLQWIGEVQMIEQQNKDMNAFVSELFEKLRVQGINALLVKGQGVAQCYEKPLWRTSGDVDLLLGKDEYTQAKAFLIPLGRMTEPEEVGKKHLALNIDGWTVELHGTLHCGLSRRVDKLLDAVQENAFGGKKSVGRSESTRVWRNGDTDVPLLPAENDAFYVFVHILQHFYKGGIGLRQICDWCRLLYAYRGTLDYVLLERWIREAGLIDEWSAFGNFAVSYLGMPPNAMPLYADSAKWTKKADKIGEFIIEVGDFGQNRDNSYFQKHSYLVRKCISAWRRVKDLCRHARIFPANSFRFFCGITYNGMVSVMRGE